MATFFPWPETVYFLEKQKTLFRLGLESAPSDDVRKGLFDKHDDIAVKMIRSYVQDSTREALIEKDLEELEKQIADNATTDEEAMKLADQMTLVAENTEKELIASLTDEVIRKNERYILHRAALDQIYTEFGGVNVGNKSGKKGKKASNKDVHEQDTEEYEDDNEGPQEQSQEYVPTLDPLTKEPLLDPVKNIRCGHFYGKASMEQMLVANRKARCPIPGCSNAQYLRNQDLVVDAEMARKIAAKISASTPTASSSSGTNKKGERKSNAVRISD